MDVKFAENYGKTTNIDLNYENNGKTHITAENDVKNAPLPQKNIF